MRFRWLPGLRLLASVACLWLAAAQVFAAYQPQLDQPGKDVVWVPTPDALASRMLDLAAVGPDDYVMDLGSGDGRLVILAARRGARALGIEYDAKLVAYAQAAAAEAGVADRARFIKADLFASDLSRATVITLFLGPDLNRRLLPKLRELKPGTRIVSNTHPIGDWPPDQTAQSSDDEATVYYRTARLWIVPARIGGVWRSAHGQFRFSQRHQVVEGTRTAGGQSAPLNDVHLRGDQITFTVQGKRYRGKVSGNVIHGSILQDGSAQPWQASRGR